MKVAKFGGSSVKDFSAMQRCAEILADDTQIKIAVLSATYNTTNDLEKMAFLSLEDIYAANEILDRLIARHRSMGHELGIAPSLSEIFFTDLLLIARSYLDEVSQKKILSNKMMDKIYALGEELSTTLFYHYLNKELLNRKIVKIKSSQLIITDNQFSKAKPRRDLIKARVEQYILPLMNEHSNTLFIIDGFVGSTEAGETTTLGREGSDYSATLLAQAIQASDVIIWTDVPGIYSADPNVISEAEVISRLTYEHASILAASGAKVLFAKTLEPVISPKINVWVKSTFRPKLYGTLITALNDENCYELQHAFLAVSALGNILTFVGNNQQFNQAYLQKNKLPATFCYHDHSASFLKLRSQKERSYSEMMQLGFEIMEMFNEDV